MVLISFGSFIVVFFDVFGIIIITTSKRFVASTIVIVIGIIATVTHSVKHVFLFRRFFFRIKNTIEKIFLFFRLVFRVFIVVIVIVSRWWGWWFIFFLTAWKLDISPPK